MKKILVLALFAAGTANAATVTVTWTNPTTNTDSSAIPASGTGSLSSARVEYGTCNGTSFGTKAGEVIRTMPVTSTTLNLNPATHCIQVKVTNTYGNESDASNVAVKVIPAPTPRPPTNLVVSDPVVFDLRQQGSQWYLSRHVGNVPVGTVAYRRYTVANGTGYCQVLRDQVEHTKPSSGVLVAKCTAES